MIYIISEYRTRAIITRSWFETALVYKPQILASKIEEFHCLVHKLSVTLTALQYKPRWRWGKNIQTGCNGTRTVSKSGFFKKRLFLNIEKKQTGQSLVKRSFRTVSQSLATRNSNSLKF